MDGWMDGFAERYSNSALVSRTINNRSRQVGSICTHLGAPLPSPQRYACRSQSSYPVVGVYGRWGWLRLGWDWVRVGWRCERVLVCGGGRGERFRMLPLVPLLMLQRQMNSCTGSTPNQQQQINTKPQSPPCLPHPPTHRRIHAHTPAERPPERPAPPPPPPPPLSQSPTRCSRSGTSSCPCRPRRCFGACRSTWWASRTARR